jgi:DNA (cytosine-5)-methyltransferase 1
MSYVEQINAGLRPYHDPQTPRVLDLFAGCGGLALGFEASGFRTHGFEMIADSCSTYRRNLLGECTQQALTLDTELPSAEIIIGGPPCQPFSVIGAQKGKQDQRDGFPIFLSAVQRLRPQLFLFENVRGLLYKNKSYFQAILQQLTALGYQVEYRLCNAVEYGVPQKRERVFVVGHQGGFTFPQPSSQRRAAGEALEQLAQAAPPDAKYLTPNMDAYIARYEAASACIRPRDLHLDEPARTLTCRNLAAATGDMMRIRLADGRRRRLTVREAARLQSFPDSYVFQGNETSQFNQVGNAVPPWLAYQFAQQVRRYFQLPAAVLQPTLPLQLTLL